MEWIDLTIAFDETVAGFGTATAKTIEKDGWNASTLSIYSHAGTHMDAPKHFAVNENGIDAFNVNRFVTTAWVVNVDVVSPSQRITVDAIADIVDAFTPGDSLLLKTGWQSKRGTVEYRNHLPRISDELAHWLVSHNANMLLVEPPSVADVNNREDVTRIHEILLGGDVIIVEGITTENFVCNRAEIIALPLKWTGGDGAPARVLAKPIL